MRKDMGLESLGQEFLNRKKRISTKKAKKVEETKDIEWDFGSGD